MSYPPVMKPDPKAMNPPHHPEQQHQNSELRHDMDFQPEWAARLGMLVFALRAVPL